MSVLQLPVHRFVGLEKLSLRLRESAHLALGENASGSVCPARSRCQPAKAIMAPLSDLVGVTRQVAVLAFQLGDGLTNVVVPTSAALMGSLGAARVEPRHLALEDARASGGSGGAAGSVPSGMRPQVIM